MIHKFAICPVISTQFDEVKREFMGNGKILLIYGQTGIHWITSAMDYPGIGKQKSYHTDVLKIQRHLVCNIRCPM